MPLYAWKGINDLGVSTKGLTQASGPDHLKELLLAKNVALLRYSTQQAGPSWATHSLQLRISSKQLCDFFDRLSLLIINGVELVHALEVVQHLTPHQGFAKIIHQLTQSIAGGQSFHAALQEYPQTFSPFVIHVVQIGEKTGKLGLVLENLKNYLIRHIELQRELKRATLAPLITLAIAGILISCILIFILPHFESLYQSLGGKLPHATQLLLRFHKIICSWYGFAWLLGIIAGTGIAKIIFKHPPIKYIIQKCALKLPIINNIIIDANIITFIQTLWLFLTSGLPLTQALGQIQSSAQNKVFQAEITQISQAILEGSSLYDAIKSSKSQFFDKQFLALVQVGERSGQLAEVLKNASAQYQNILSSKLHTLTTIFSPLIMIVIGLLIGGIMVLIYLPIFSLGDLFGQ